MPVSLNAEWIVGFDFVDEDQTLRQLNRKFTLSP
jgi:hypothetical protein